MFLGQLRHGIQRGQAKVMVVVWGLPAESLTRRYKPEECHCPLFSLQRHVCPRYCNNPVRVMANRDCLVMRWRLRRPSPRVR